VPRANKKSANQGRSSSPRQGAQQNSTWPVPLLQGRSSKHCFCCKSQLAQVGGFGGSNTRRMRVDRIVFVAVVAADSFSQLSFRWFARRVAGSNPHPSEGQSSQQETAAENHVARTIATFKRDTARQIDLGSIRRQMLFDRVGAHRSADECLPPPAIIQVILPPPRVVILGDSSALPSRPCPPSIDATVT
jgi:hypothetical protein